MDQRHARRHELEALGRDLAELAADHQQAVRGVDQVVGDARVAPEEPGRERMRAGDAALAAHGMRDRNAERLGQLLQRGVGAGQMHAAAGQDQRPLRLREEGRRAHDVVGRGPDAPARNVRVRLVDPELVGVVVELAVADILRHVEHDRARPPAGRDRVGAAHQLGNPPAVLDPDDLLHDRRQHLHLMAFLGHVLPGMQAVGVARHRDDRRAGVIGFRETGHEIGHAGPERAVADARPPRDPRIGVGGKRAGPLVVDQAMAEAQRAHRFVERQELEAAHAEHHVRAMGAQHLGQRLAAGHPAQVIVGVLLAHAAPSATAASS